MSLIRPCLSTTPWGGSATTARSPLAPHAGGPRLGDDSGSRMVGVEPCVVGSAVFRSDHDAVDLGALKVAAFGQRVGDRRARRRRDWRAARGPRSWRIRLWVLTDAGDGTSAGRLLAASCDVVTGASHCGGYDQGFGLDAGERLPDALGLATVHGHMRFHTWCKSLRDGDPPSPALVMKACRPSRRGQ